MFRLCMMLVVAALMAAISLTAPAADLEPQPGIKIDKEKRVLWTWRDFERFGNATSNCWVID